MNNILSTTTGHIYKHAVKPILFRQLPDDVHARMLRVASTTQRSRTVRLAAKLSLAYANNAFLGQTIYGIKFNNPVGLSAGFDKNFELVPTMKGIGFGFMEGGSLTYHHCKGNPRPWFYRLSKSQSLVVHVGLANQGVKAIIDRIKGYPYGTFNQFPLNISVAKTNSEAASTDEAAIQDYVGSLRCIKQARIGSMITLNISCPNTYGGEPFTTPKRLDKLLTEVDKVWLKQPIFIKMPINLPWEEFKKLLDIAVAHRIVGVTISNLNKDFTGLQDTVPASITGGLSGKPTFKLSNDLIAKTYREYGDRFVIIGVGGIFSAEDAYTKIKLGASLVELITGMIYEGPQIVGQINRGLVNLLEKDGYKNISQAIGVASDWS